MQKLEESSVVTGVRSSTPLPVTAIVAARNEARNLPRCLASLSDLAEVYVVDSQSTDQTPSIARSYGAKLVQFHYQGGWPKKRQWAMDSLPLSGDWIFLIDADEAMTPALMAEIREAIQDPAMSGYYIGLRMFFLGRELRHSGASFYKLSLFRRGQGRFECRLKDQDVSMADMEVHEHVIVEGKTATLKHPLLHHNVESLSHYIRKHDEYSNWEARVWLEGAASPDALPPAFFGSQAQRRRWLRKKFFALPGSPLALFLYRYVFRFGFMDGVPGLIYCSLQAMQFFNVKAKIFELRVNRQRELQRQSPGSKALEFPQGPQPRPSTGTRD